MNTRYEGSGLDILFAGQPAAAEPDGQADRATAAAAAAVRRRRGGVVARGHLEAVRHPRMRSSVVLGVDLGRVEGLQRSRAGHDADLQNSSDFGLC